MIQKMGIGDDVNQLLLTHSSFSLGVSIPEGGGHRNFLKLEKESLSEGQTTEIQISLFEEAS